MAQMALLLGGRHELPELCKNSLTVRTVLGDWRVEMDDGTV